MNIWLIQTGEPLPLKNNIRKMRTAMLADQLIGRGHTVFWWTSAFEHQQKKWVADKNQDFQMNSNFTIGVLHGSGYRENISLSRYIDHWIVALKFRLESKNKSKPDIIVTSTPCYLLAYESMRLAIRSKIPYIVDIRDLWPDIFFEQLKKYKLENIGRIVLYFDCWKLNRLLIKADALIAISEGCLSWGLNKARRSRRRSDRVFYHGYKKNKKNADKESYNKYEQLKTKKIILFVGTFGYSYELELILKAAIKFQNDNEKSICFILAGIGEQFDELKKASFSLKNVIMPGWISKEEIDQLLNLAWAGVVPCKSVRNAAPNKVFEYLSTGLPLISSLEGEIADIIDKHNIGMNYQPGDLEGLYRCIKKITSDSYIHDEMSKNALGFFQKYGDAEKIYGEYAEFVERVAKDYRYSNRKM